MHPIVGKIRSFLSRTIYGTRNMWSKEKRTDGLKKMYFSAHNRQLQLTPPTLFTEKLQWYKLNYSNKKLINAVDKYLFKQYISEKLGEGYTVPLIGVWKNIRDLDRDWETLPQTFVLKSTLQSDGRNILIVKNKEEFNYQEMRKELKQWLMPYNTLINSFCSAYYQGVPRIIAEKYEAQIDGQLFDYKIFCFSGKPYCFYVATDHFPGQLSHISFYDLEWNRLDVRYGKHLNCDVEKPVHFDEMLMIAERLSKDFPFVRVDFFDTGEKLYVAELTFYPGGGLIPYDPIEFDKQLGDMFRLQ